MNQKEFTELVNTVMDEKDTIESVTKAKDFNRYCALDKAVKALEAYKALTYGDKECMA